MGFLYARWPSLRRDLQAAKSPIDAIFMSSTLATQLKDQLEQHLRTRTGRRIRNLAIELDPRRVVLRGQVSSYYVKQMAQQGLRDFLPNLLLENSLIVEKEPGGLLFQE